MDGKTAHKFVICHALFLLTLVVIYFIPRLCGIEKGSLLPPLDRPVRFAMIGVFSLSFLFYYLYLFFGSASKVRLFGWSGLSAYFWLSTLAVFVLLLFSDAVLSTDLYEYSLRARMISIYHLNPYLHLPTEVKADMFFPLLFWKTTPECYGPLWTLIGTLPSLAFKDSLILTSFAHKAVLFIFFALSALILWKIAGELKFKNKDILTLAFLTNPLIIIMTLVDGHNEIVMVFFMLASLYFILRAKYIPALLFFTAATQVKFVYLLLTPLMLLTILLGQGKDSIKKRLPALITGIIASAAFVVLAWLPFGWRSVTAIIDFYRDLGKRLSPDSLPYVVYFLFEKTGLKLSARFVENMFSVIFIVIYAYLIYDFVKNIRRGKEAIMEVSSLMLLALFATNYSPFQSWYLLWLLPLLFLSRFKGKFALILFLSYFLLIIFWKRMSVLAIPMMALYAVVLSQYGKYKDKLRFFFALE